MTITENHEIEKLTFKLEKAAEKWLNKPEDEILFNTAISAFRYLLEEYYHNKDFEITNEWFIETVCKCCDIRKKIREQKGLQIRSEEL